MRERGHAARAKGKSVRHRKRSLTRDKDSGRGATRPPDTLSYSRAVMPARTAARSHAFTGQVGTCGRDGRGAPHRTTGGT